MTYLPETIENIVKTLEIATNKNSNSQVTYDEVVEKINQIYYFVISRKNEELENIFCNLSLDTIITLLQYDEEINKKVIKILEAYIKYKTINVIIDQYENFIAIGLKNENPEIVILTLRELISGINKNDEKFKYKIASLFLLEIINCLATKDIKVTQLSSKLLINLFENEQCLQLVLQNEIINQLCSMCEKNEVVKFNIYEVIITLCAKSEEHFQKFKKTEIFNKFENEIMNSDILAKLNTIELYVKLLENENTFLFFEKSKIFLHMVETLKSSVDEANEKTVVEKQLLIHGIIKFIGQLADKNMDNFKTLQEKYNIMEIFEKMYNECDISTKEIIVTTVGNIGASYEGLLVLYYQKKLIYSIIDNYPTLSGQLKIVFLQSISCILTICKLSQEVESITQEIYNRIKGKPTFLKEIIQISCQIFEESRIAAYAVIKGISVHKWGLKELDNSTEFIKFIFDRGTESSKLGQEWKYSIIQTMMCHPNSSETLRQDTLTKIKRYLREGPFYEYVEPKVVIKGS